MPSTWAVLLAAGKGSRLAKAGIDTPKQFLSYRGAPLFWRSARVLAGLPELEGLVFVLPPDQGDGEDLIRKLEGEAPLGVAWRVTRGGARRQDSVAAGLAEVPPDCGRVLVHDSARPFLTPSLCASLLDALESADAAIPGLPVTDTIKVVEDGLAAETPDRSRLAAVQTPQAFRADVLRRGHETARAEDWDVTDDAMLVERLGGSVAVVPGDPGNIKITNPEDLRLLEDSVAPSPVPVTGFGYDVHKYGSGRPFILAGVHIQGAPEVVAHSDGDCLVHAVIDAILGCLGRGDIGQHFPDTSAEFDNVPSSVLLDQVLEMAREDGTEIVHLDCKVICQTPRIDPHSHLIRKSLARMLGMDETRVNLAATTEEGLGFTGEKRGLKCVAVCTALRPLA
ncbi:2-C-methyl-D-erythritol 4-phosphate cytidylyltransferase [Desulfohalovibrio reitneri]|uniref:2-C-methyl-D-erythritol 4-phosphate cytidylyltransferase n=1 Tax=Desulfohalovibrio reitneri TaxID=1307759 RepID=UPI0004A6E904|nr:2-C-methyl-D-erythritol 4-phosphate cytidylyltransferase [Desulfohalovibrio reitneri]